MRTTLTECQVLICQRQRFFIHINQRNNDRAVQETPPYRQHSPTLQMLKTLSFVVLAILGAKLLVWRSKKSGKLPPGPPKLPIIDNLLNMPRELDWVALAELGKQNGERAD